MMMEIQVLPDPAGTAHDTYAHIDAAIEVIVESGLVYDVGPLGTCVEGTADDLWRLARKVHEATLHAGARQVVSIIKMADIPGPTSPMSALTARYRR